MLSPEFQLCPQDGLWKGPWEWGIQLWAGRANCLVALKDNWMDDW